MAFPKPQKAPKSLKRTVFSKPELIIFALVFAAIGGYVLYKSYAYETGTTQANGNVITQVTQSFGGYSSSVQIGSDNLPVIAVGEGGLLSIMHCNVADCSSYSFKTINTSPNSVGIQGHYVYMAIGTDGLPIVSYDNNTTHNLDILHCGNVTCTAGNTITPIETADNDGQTSKAVIGSDGLPIIIYSNATTSDVAVLHCGNVACSTGNTNIVLNTPDIDGLDYTTIAITSDGLPLLGYPDWTTGNIGVTKCANLDCTSIASSTDISSAHGVYPSMFIGSDGLPIMSYTAGNNNVNVPPRDQGIIHCGNLACSSGNTVTTLPTADDDGIYARLVIQTDGLPLIAYHDATNTDIYVVKCGNLVCDSGNTTTQIASPDKIGNTISLKIGKDGKPLIAYGNNTDFVFYVLHCGNADCSDSVSSDPMPGDVNSDGVVNGIDVSTILSHFDGPGTLATGDANNNGYVDGLDLSLVLTHFGP